MKGKTILKSVIVSAIVVLVMFLLISYMASCINGSCTLSSGAFPILYFVEFIVIVVASLIAFGLGDK